MHTQARIPQTDERNKVRGLSSDQSGDQYYGEWTSLATVLLVAVILPGIICMALGILLFLRYRASPAYAADVDAKRAKKAAEVENNRLAQLNAAQKAQNQQPPMVVKEREMIREREIVKVKCSYCGTLNPQESQKCSSCGAHI